MQFTEFGKQDGKTLLLLPGTACTWQLNFKNVVDELAEKYLIIAVNYDGFEGNPTVIFSSVPAVTEKIENYILEKHNGRVDGAYGSSLGGSFVGLLIQRKRVHIDHGFIGSSDLDQGGKLTARLLTAVVSPMLSGACTSEKKRAALKAKLQKKGAIGDGEKSVYEHKNSFTSGYWGFEDDTVETSNLGMYAEDYLKNVDIPDTVVCINDGAFSDSSIHFEEFVLPDHLERLGPRAFGGRYSSMSVGRFTISEDNVNYKTVGGVLFSKDGKTLLRFPTKADTDLEAVANEKDGRDSHYVYQIPEGCETVGKYAFANATLIKKESLFDSAVDDFSVRFSPDVVLVDEYAFDDSEINAVYLNEGLETIADRAFYSSKLKDDVLTLPSTVTSLGNEAFASIYREVCGFSHIELPEGLKSIGESAFSSYKTDLVCDELVIGKKLTNIAEGAFKGLKTSGFAVDPGNSKFSSENGCLLDADGETLITVPQGMQGESQYRRECRAK